MQTTTKADVRVERSCSVRITLPLPNDEEMRKWLISTKKVAICARNDDWLNLVNKEITVTYFFSGKNEQNFYRAVEEWCQQKGYSLELPQPTQ